MKRNLDSDLKAYKALTPSLRQRVQVHYPKLLSPTGPFSKLLKGMKRKGGRNQFGRLTAFRKGGGHKRSYRFLSDYDVKRHLPFSVVHSVEYDPFRTAFVACAYFYEGGFFQYLLAAQGTEVGQVLGANYYFALPGAGSPCYVQFARIGDFLYNLELNPDRRYTVARAAGTACKVMQKDLPAGFSRIALPSGNLFDLSFSALGFLGKVSNPGHRFTCISKAGRARWMGRRPVVRGVAMNPVDHPHGGGEGKASGGRPSSTPWGYYTKGRKTRSQKALPFFVRKLKDRRRKA